MRREKLEPTLKYPGTFLSRIVELTAPNHLRGYAERLRQLGVRTYEVTFDPNYEPDFRTGFEFARKEYSTGNVTVLMIDELGDVGKRLHEMI